MYELKDMDYKILFELMKNAHVSDRKLAQKLGSSQPTITRRRRKLEKEVIDSYTIIPKWTKFGYNLLVFTLVKSLIHNSKEEYQSIVNEGIKWVKKQPNILMAGACEGMGMTSFIISIHKTYGDYSEFIVKLRLALGNLMNENQNIIVNLAAKHRIGKPFQLSFFKEAK